jgi:hypothetical protein
LDKGTGTRDKKIGNDIFGIEDLVLLDLGHWCVSLIGTANLIEAPILERKWSGNKTAPPNLSKWASENPMSFFVESGGYLEFIPKFFYFNRDLGIGLRHNF